VISVVNFRLKNYVSFLQQLGGNFAPAMRRGVLSGTLRSIPILLRATSEAPPANPGMVGSGGAVNTGRYRQSWSAEPTSKGAVVYNSAPYSPIVEYGRRPFSRRPPVRPLELWAMRRLGAKAADAKSIAWAIATAIARRGLVARKVMTNALPAIVDAVDKGITAELQKELARP